jgi:uncharacterized protein
MNKHILSLTLLFSFAVNCDTTATKSNAKAKPSQATTSAPKGKKSKEALITEMLKETMFTNEFYSAMEKSLKQIATQLNSKDPEKTADKLYKAFKNNFDASMSKFVEFYNKNFTEKEIEELVKWYNTETAKKFNRLTGEISQLSMEVSQEALMKAMSTVQNEITPPASKTEPAKGVASTKTDAKPTASKTNSKTVKPTSNKK